MQRDAICTAVFRSSENVYVWNRDDICKSEVKDDDRYVTYLVGKSLDT